MNSRLDQDEPEGDIELTEVGLLAPQDEGEDAHTWYSAHGRGYSVNGAQGETKGDTSHIGTVLGERYYARERKNQRVWEFITERPSKACNVPTLGLQTLESGGNAADAAVATALCQGVMSPVASGIGGGAFILVRTPNGTVEFIDARETAPAAANESMLEGSDSKSFPKGLKVAVPLELKGLWTLHERYGNMSWHLLVEPSAALARTGFPAQPYLVDKITDKLAIFQGSPELRQTFLIEDDSTWRPPKVNETCCQRPQLASLLDDIALTGPDALYATAKAEGLAEDIQAAGGVVTAEDLRSAQPVLRPALRAKAFGLDIALPPPPSSAAVIIAALNVLQGYALRLPFAGPVAPHWLVEAMKTAFALRTHLGDPGACSSGSDCFLDLDAVLNATLSPSFAEGLRANLTDSSTQPWDAYGGVWQANGTLGEDNGTSHINVVDSSRMAVAITSTINTAFGSYVYSISTGILLNDEMDDFSTPNKSNTYGLRPSIPNRIQPGKRPLSSMSPIILSDESGLRAVLGASGGPRIVSAVLTTLYRLLVLGMDPLPAISLARLHHQLLPDHVSAESWSTTAANFTVGRDTVLALERRGHEVVPTVWGGVCQATVVDPDTGSLVAASDPRKDGAPAGS